MTTFEQLGLAAPLLKALAGEGYTTPTPIQAQAIPPCLAGNDILGIAQTGTGKTAAFALPILQHLAKDQKRPAPRSCRVLVLSPTRELASQIEASFKVYGRFLRQSSAVVFGGVPVGKQIRACAGGLDVVVATPGRLLDLIDQRALSLAHVEILVLDEADQMLDMGFIHAIRRIVALVPKRRQSLFFSATMPKEIAELAGQLLRDPVRVAVTPVASTVERVSQAVIHCEGRDKQAVLHALLGDAGIARALVFTRTKHGADRVVKHLAAAGIPADAIHGNKSQGQRERALAMFRAGRSRLLVATDIAARGIDVDAVSHVINFDLPNVPEAYVHRIGRTARAGAEGIAISLCGSDERTYLRDIERLTRQKVSVQDNPLGATARHAPVEAAASDRPRSDRQGGRRQQGNVHAPARQGGGAAPRANAGRRQPRGGAGGHNGRGDFASV